MYFPIKVEKEIIFTNRKSKIKKFYWGLPHIPPKEFFLPACKDIFCHNNNQTKAPQIDQTPKVLFGVHPYDVKAINLLDKIFTNKYPDIYYQRRRKTFFIIGMGDYEFKNLFEPDIFFNSNADTYEVVVKNQKAAHLLDYRGMFSKSVFEEENIYYQEDPIFSNIKKLSQAVERSYSSKIWDELARIDLGCGICSYTCPLCYCFDLKDKFLINNKCQSKTIRSWSSCFHTDFFEVSGHNFKSKLRDRFYNWYYHKFVRMPREIGHVGCVDCGRCIKYCPAKINFKHVLKSLM